MAEEAGLSGSMKRTATDARCLRPEGGDGVVVHGIARDRPEQGHHEQDRAPHRSASSVTAPSTETRFVT